MEHSHSITGKKTSSGRIVAKLTCPHCQISCGRWDEMELVVDGAPKTLAVCPKCNGFFGPVRFDGDSCYITEAED